MRVLAVDPGEKRIGLAISDPLGMLARPLAILQHKVRATDAQAIVQIAEENSCSMIIVGQALDSDGQIGYRARKSGRLVDELRKYTKINIILWDESGTTRVAIQQRIDSGVSKKKRKIAFDDLAAAILLEDYLSSEAFKILAKEKPNEQK
ncbi:MAG: Holliday junction resolvase RuvX [Chloroflexota bacterium]